MKVFTVFVIVAVLASANAFRMPAITNGPGGFNIRRFPVNQGNGGGNNWARLEVRGNQWRMDDLKAQLLQQLKQQQQRRQFVEEVRVAEPDACAGRPEKLCWNMAKKFCGVTNKYGQCRKIYVQFCKRPVAVPLNTCRAVTEQRCRGAKGQAFAVCVNACGNQCREQARCAVDVPEPVPEPPMPEPVFCRPGSFEACKAASRKACGVTNKYGHCRDQFRFFCQRPAAAADCKVRTHRACQAAGDKKRYGVCYKALHTQCQQQMTCGPDPEPEPEPEPEPQPLPAVCTQRPKKICWKLAQKACGVTNRFGLCREVFTRFCMKPVPRARNICDKVARGRCGKTTGSAWDRCVAIAKRQCNEQVVCLAPPKPEPEPEPQNERCLPQNKKICHKEAGRKCGVTNKYGLCRAVYVAACLKPQARESCEDWAKESCVKATNKHNANAVCVKAAIGICQAHAECGKPEPVPRFVPKKCRPGTPAACAKYAAHKSICSVTNKYGVCRQIVTEECVQRIPRADCDAYIRERCSIANTEKGFKKCFDKARDLCRKIQDCGEPEPAPKPEPKLPKFCAARPRWACEKEAKLRQICAVTNKYGVCRKAFIEFCQKPEPQADCSQFAQEACAEEKRQGSFERCVNVNEARCEAFNKQCLPPTTAAPTTVVKPTPVPTTTPAPPTTVKPTLPEKTEDPEEEKEDEEDKEREEEEEEDEKEREEEEEFEEEFEGEKTPEPEPEPEKEWEPRDFWDCWTYCDGRDGGRDIDLKNCKFPGDLLTHAATTVKPTTAAPTTAAPTTAAPTTAAPTTAAPTTVKPTTAAPTTAAPTTAAPTTAAPTTVKPTTAAPTTVKPTTVAPTTAAPTTPAVTGEDPARLCPEGTVEVAKYEWTGKWKRERGEDVKCGGDAEQVCWEVNNIDCVVLKHGKKFTMVETPTQKCMRKPDKHDLSHVKFCVKEGEEPQPPTPPTPEPEPPKEPEAPVVA